MHCVVVRCASDYFIDLAVTKTDLAVTKTVLAIANPLNVFFFSNSLYFQTTD